MNRHLSRCLAGALTALTLVAACGTQVAVSELSIEVTEYRIEPSHEVLASGEVTMQVGNTGKLPHTIVIGTPAGEVIDATDVILSGESATLVVALEPGDYEFTCRIVADIDGELLDHYELGMVRTFTVTG